MMWTVLRRVLAVVVCALALASCRLDVTVDVAIEPDGTGTVTVTAVADAELVDQVPGLADALVFDDAVAAGWQVDGPTATAEGVLWQTVIHVVFILSAIGIAYVDRLGLSTRPGH